MRQRTRILTIAAGVAVSVIASPPARAQAGDGTITFVSHGDDGKTGTMIQTTKGPKLRLEAGGADSGSGAFIVDGSTGTTTILSPKDQVYMQFTKADAQKAAVDAKPYIDALPKSTGTAPPPAAPPPPPPPSKANIQVTKIGTERVAGVSCDNYKITGTDDQGKPINGEICAAQGVGFFLTNVMAGMTGMMGGANPAASRMAASDPGRYAVYKDVLSDGKGIIKISGVDNKTGKMVVAMEATKIDRTPPPDSVFQVPANYTKFAMPSLGQLLKGSPSTTNPDGSTTTSSPGAVDGATNAAAAGAGSAAADQAKKAAKKLLHFP